MPLVNNSDFIYRSGTCIQCNARVVGDLTRQFFNDLSEHFTYVCRQCKKKGCFGGQLYIPNAAVLQRITERELKLLPIIAPCDILICERCGSIGAQYHHWGPREIFPDAEEWPKGLLCLKCHRIWHDTIKAFYSTKVSP